MSPTQIAGVICIALGLLLKRAEQTEALPPAQETPAGGPPPNPEAQTDPARWRKPRKDRPGYKKYQARGAKLLVGATGSGKSFHLMHHLIPELLADGRDLVLIHDPHGDYTEGKSWRSVKEFKSPKAQWERVNIFPGTRATPREMALLATELGQRFGLRVVLVMDEMTLVAKAKSGFLDGLPVKRGEKQPPTPLEKIIRMGRHWGVELIGTAQRPVDFPAELRSQTYYMWVFALLDETDLEWVERTNQKVGALARQIDPARFQHVLFDRFTILREPPRISSPK